MPRRPASRRPLKSRRRKSRRASRPRRFRATSLEARREASEKKAVYRRLQFEIEKSRIKDKLKRNEEVKGYSQDDLDQLVLGKLKDIDANIVQGSENKQKFGVGKERLDQAVAALWNMQEAGNSTSPNDQYSGEIRKNGEIDWKVVRSLYPHLLVTEQIFLTWKDKFGKEHQEAMRLPQTDG